MKELTFALLGVIGTLAAIFVKQAVQEAHLRRVRAWQLFGYLLALKRQILGNEQIFAIYHEVEKREKSLRSSYASGTETFEKHWMSLSKERTEFREALKKTLLQELTKNSESINDLLPDALLKIFSSALEYRRSLLVNAKTFMSDENAAILGSAVAVEVIQFRTAMIEVFSAFEDVINLLSVKHDLSTELITRQASQIVRSGDDALVAFIRLEHSLHAISRQSLLKHTLSVMRSQ